ncbi:hypothetical protein HDV00_011621 [Rhizophlyctis rosea]|nr:hypothetical protein HDV00_011621 [Rhizophlyctis rosea]
MRMTWENTRAIDKTDIFQLDLAWTLAWNDAILDKLLTRSLTVTNQTGNPWSTSCDASEYQIWKIKYQHCLNLLPANTTDTDNIMSIVQSRFDADAALQTASWDVASAAIDFNGSQYNLSAQVMNDTLLFKDASLAHLLQGVDTLHRTTRVTTYLSMASISAIALLEIFRFMYAVSKRRTTSDATLVSTTKTYVRERIKTAKDRITLSNTILLFVSVGAVVDESATKFVLSQKMNADIKNMVGSLQFYNSAYESQLFNEELIFSAGKFVATGNEAWGDMYRKINDTLNNLPVTFTSDPGEFIKHQFDIMFEVNDVLVGYENP